MGINGVFLSGNLGRNAETRTTANGTKTTRFSVAFSERIIRDGNWENETGWINCVIFGDRGEKVASNLTKGTPISVQGKLKYSSYIDRNNTKRSSYEIIVEDFSYGKKSTEESDDLALADEDFTV